MSALNRNLRIIFLSRQSVAVDVTRLGIWLLRDSSDYAVHHRYFLFAFRTQKPTDYWVLCHDGDNDEIGTFRCAWAAHECGVP
jgi:hypothetical protein